MRTRAIGAIVLAAAVVALVVASFPSAREESSGHRATRTADGKPDLNGIWQAHNTANWDLQAHNAKPGPFPMLGAVGAIPPGLGVVEGDEIPYQPAALQKKQENAAKWAELDPEVKCYMPGIPRATYMPHPFQIVQSQGTILMAYQYATAKRVIPIGPRKEEPPVDTWMGESVGSWEGDTLVIDTKGLNDQTWFDRAGNHHSEALHVVERFTPVDGTVLNYQATIDDPKTFTRAWKIAMPLYKNVEPNAQLLEFKCVEFAEEMLYGHLVKPGSPKY